MTQQLLNIGSTANDGTGDTWRSGGNKINENFTEVYGFQANNTIIVNEEADFPVQDATTITLEAGTGYYLGAVITTGKRFICGNGSVLRSPTGFSLGLIYTGVSDLFTMGTNVFFQLTDIQILAPTGNIFSYNGAGALDVSNTVILACVDVGDFTPAAASAIVMDNVAVASSTGQGLNFTGAFNLLSLERILFFTTSASGIFCDLNNSTWNDIVLTRLELSGPSGSVALAGVANSANVNTGKRAILKDSILDGNAMTPLSLIDPQDVRWQMSGNSGIEKSMDAADTYLSASQTVVIATQSVFVTVDGGNWLSTIADRFTTDAAGLITYVGDTDITIKVSGGATVSKVGGGSDEIEVRIALNGTTLPRSAAVTQNASPTSVPIEALVSVVTNDTIDMQVANNGGTSDIVVDRGTLVVTGA